MKKNKSFYIILISIVLAIFAGVFSGTEKGLFGVTFYSVENKGYVLKNLSSAAVEFDYTGLNIGVGISIAM